MDKIRFRVASYALQDVIRALSVRHKDFYNEIYVTKEDGELLVVCNKRYLYKYSAEIANNAPDGESRIIIAGNRDVD